MELPVDIMLDILTRLPTESVLESKLVSKYWRDVVRHPSFSQKHLNHLRSADDSGNLGFLFTDYTVYTVFASKQFYYFEYNETHITTPRRINLTPEFLNFYSFVGSCNGLICLYQLGSFIICNPITREYGNLPKLNSFIFLCYGFGYLVSTNEYKVVIIYELEERNSIEAEVYTLGSGNGWRNVGKLNYEYRSLYDKPGVLVNGSLHWAVSGKQMIVAFDLADEKFRKIPLPTIPQNPHWNVYFEVVGSLGDSLMCVDFMRVRSGRSLGIWVLKESGIPDINWEVDYKSMKWSKEFDVGGMIPFAFTNSGAVLCFKASHGNPNVCRYDLKSSSLEILGSFDKQHSCPPTAHMNTLVSLEALGEENSKRMV